MSGQKDFSSTVICSPSLYLEIQQIGVDQFVSDIEPRAMGDESYLLIAYPWFKHDHVEITDSTHSKFLIEVGREYL